MSNLITATTDSVARFVKSIGDPQRYGFSLTRRWEKVHASSVSGLVAALNAVKRYTNPKADKVSYTGTFIQSEAPSVVDEKDAISISQTLTKIRTLATDSNAVLISQQGDPRHAGYKVTRGWPYFDPTSADTTFTALKNTLSYRNPKADNQSYTDTFCHSITEPVKENDQTVSLIQTLTKVKSATDSSDANLVSITGDPAVTGSELVRAWHYINPISVKRLQATLDGIKTYSNGVKANNILHSGKYVVSKVVSSEENDRTYKIEQSVTKVKAVTSDTSLSNPLVDRRKDIIHPFGKGTGTEWSIVFRYLNLDPTTDTKCISIADTSLEKKMGSTYDLIDRKTTTNDNRTMTFWLLAEKKSRIAWSSTVHNAPDYVNKENPNRDDEIKTRVWFGIRASHADSVRTDLETDTFAGYSVLRVNQKNDDNGADDWEQVLVKTHNDTRTDSTIIGTHSLEHLALKRKHTEYRNYTASKIPADPSITTGYHFTQVESRMNSNGLLDKSFIQEKPVASNTVSQSTHQPARHKVTAEANADADTFAGNEIEWEFDRVPITAVDTALQYLKNVTGDTYVVPSVRYSDYGDGSAKLTRRLKKLNKTGKYYIQTISPSSGDGSAGIVRVWPNVSDTKAGKLMVGAAQDTLSYGGLNYPPVSARRELHGDGTSTVTQILQFPRYNINVTGGDSYYSVSYVYISRKSAQKRRTTWVKKYTSFSNAQSWVETVDATDKPFGKIDGTVVSNGDGSYTAYKVRYSTV